MQEGGSNTLLSSPCLWKDCDAAFATREELYMHLCTRHAGHDSADSDKEAQLTCGWKDCNGVLTCSGGISCAIVEHFIGHAGLFPFICGIFGCRLAFQSHSEIMEHMNAAHNVQLAVVVASPAAQRGVVEMRWTMPPMDTRTSEKHICRWMSCGQVFNTAPELQLHFITHHRPPHMPEVAVSRRLQVPEIQEVIEVHGDRLQCPFCPNKYLRRSFVSHLKRTHGRPETLPQNWSTRKPRKRKRAISSSRAPETHNQVKKLRRQESPGLDVGDDEVSSDSDAPLIKGKEARGKSSKSDSTSTAATNEEDDAQTEKDLLDPELFAPYPEMKVEVRGAGMVATPETDDSGVCLDPKLFEQSSAAFDPRSANGQARSPHVAPASAKGKSMQSQGAEISGDEVESGDDLQADDDEPEEDWSLT